MKKDLDFFKTKKYEDLDAQLNAEITNQKYLQFKSSSNMSNINKYNSSSNSIKLPSQSPPIDPLEIHKIAEKELEPYLHKLKSDLEYQMINYRKEFEDYNKIKTELNELKEKYDDLTSKNKVVNSSNDDKFSSLNKTVKDLSMSNERINKKISAIDKQISTLEQKNDNLYDKMEKNNSINEGSNNIDEEVYKNIEKNINENIQVKIDLLNTDIKSYENKIGDLNNKITNIEVKNINLKNEIDNLKQLFIDQTNSYNEYKNKFGELSSNCGGAISKIVTFESKLNNSINKITSLSNELNTNNENVKIAQMAIKSFNTEIDDINKTLNNFDDKLNNQISNVTVIQNEINSFNQANKIRRKFNNAKSDDLLINNSSDSNNSNPNYKGLKDLIDKLSSKITSLELKTDEIIDTNSGRTKSVNAKLVEIVSFINDINDTIPESINDVNKRIDDQEKFNSLTQQSLNKISESLTKHEKKMELINQSVNDVKNINQNLINKGQKNDDDDLNDDQLGQIQDKVLQKNLKKINSRIENLIKNYKMLNEDTIKGFDNVNKVQNELQNKTKLAIEELKKELDDKFNEIDDQYRQDKILNTIKNGKNIDDGEFSSNRDSQLSKEIIQIRNDINGLKLKYADKVAFENAKRKLDIVENNLNNLILNFEDKVYEIFASKNPSTLSKRMVTGNTNLNTYENDANVNHSERGYNNIYTNNSNNTNSLLEGNKYEINTNNSKREYINISVNSSSNRGSNININNNNENMKIESKINDITSKDPNFGGGKINDNQSYNKFSEVELIDNKKNFNGDYLNNMIVPNKTEKLNVEVDYNMDEGYGGYDVGGGYNIDSTRSLHPVIIKDSEAGGNYNFNSIEDIKGSIKDYGGLSGSKNIKTSEDWDD